MAAITVESISKVFYSGNKAAVSNGGATALENVSFAVGSGEVFGIIGENGSGKSTLLKLLSGILKPSKGQIKIKGRVASVLDIGSGFHPDLTGTENVFMAGELLGISKKEIAACYNDIVRFSGIESSMNTAIKYYSSGMYMRLAFAVFSHLPTDVLLLDEVLSVGDAAFSMQAVERMKHLKQLNKTIVIATHDLAAAKELCDRCILLQHGKIVFNGNVSEAILTYVTSSVQTYVANDTSKFIEEPLAAAHEKEEVQKPQSIDDTIRIKEPAAIEPLFKYENTLAGNDQLKYIGVKVFNTRNSQEFESADALSIELTFTKVDEVPVSLAFMFTASLVDPLFISSQAFAGELSVPYYTKTGSYTVVCSVPAFTFNSGIFGMDVFFMGADSKELLHFRNALIFSVHYNPEYLTRYNYDGKFPGSIIIPLSWNVK